MPHLILEYSDNLNAYVSIEKLLSELQKTFTAFESIPLAETKTRALAFTAYEVGAQGKNASFMHLNILMMSGRPQALRTHIGEAVLAFLTSYAAKIPTELACSLSIEIREMEKSNYFKTKVHEAQA